MSEFIQLDREFFPLPDKYTHKAKDDSLDMQAALGFSYNTVKWIDLFQEYRAIILAEAGAGKTHEIRHAAEQLQKEGKCAFFLRLENISSEFELAFEVGSYSQFNAWINSNEDGWLFLDSVDEARLRHPNDFELAIKKLSARIATAYLRLHIVITSRVSAWRPKSDLEICKKYFPFKVSAAISSVVELESGETSNKTRAFSVEEIDVQKISEDESFKVWSITNLSREQIDRFVRQKNIADPIQFMSEIERRDAWAFTTRPQDLEEILEYWDTHKQIGSRYELMVHSIQRRLKERDQNREEVKSIALEKARKGIQLLAAASTFMHQSTIRVPDGSSNQEGIDPQLILSGWNTEECQTLLSRPIFDEAIYGTVRFHHRSVKEFLAAEWLAEKLNEHGSRQKIEALFFQQQYGIWVIVPSMKPLLSWLVLMDERILRRVHQLEPEIILQGGDPVRLPLEIRKQLLHDVCDKIANGTASHSVGDLASVQRFASHDLAADIRNLLVKHKTNREVLYYLLQLTWQSGIHELEDEVKAIASDSSIEPWVRTSAIRTLKIIGKPENFKLAIDRFLTCAEKLDREILAEIIDNLDGTEDQSDRIISAIGNADKKRPHKYEGLGFALTRFIERATADVVSKIVEGIDGLLHQEPFLNRTYCHVSEQHGWLMPISVKAVEKLLINRHPGAVTDPSLFVLAVAPACRDFGDFDMSQLKHDLWKLVPQWPAFNHLLFWKSVEQTRKNIEKQDKGRLTNEWPVSWHHPYWSFSENDFNLIVNDVRARNLLDDRLVALSVGFRLYAQNKRPRQWLSLLKNSVKGNGELEKSLYDLLHPPPLTQEARRMRNQAKQRKRQDVEREKKRKKDHEESVKWLQENIDQLRGDGVSKGSLSNAQYWLFLKMQQYNTNQSNRWTSGYWIHLIPDYGIEVAQAFRSGMVNFWRSYTPALRSEFDKGNSTPVEIVFGISALDVESSETSDWINTLTTEDAELACRYACHELNDFPAWLPDLYQKFPDIIRNIILQEIYWELDNPATAERRLYILHKAGSYGKWLWDGIAVDLLKRLSIDPPNAEYLTDLLNIIQKSSVVKDDELSSLAMAKCQSHTPMDHLPYWYAAWIGINPRLAIAALTTFLSERAKTDETTAKQTAMKTIVALVGAKRKSVNTREEFKTTEHLKNLYLLAHKYIRVEEDVKHEGVYSPGLRDDAQEARRMLFGMLRDIKGKESYLAILEIAQFQATENEKIWMTNNARERAEEDADMAPWSGEIFIEFSKSMERTPSNHRELFHLAHQRMLDLKYYLEEGDDSIASILSGNNSETQIRTFIAAWCRERSVGRYIISQEEELADAKRPDCRFLSSRFDGPVPVELKIADKWTGPKLFERLKNQLCGDYLRDVRSGCGIFVLVYKGDIQNWRIPGSGEKANFTGLIEHLQNHWEKISNTFPTIERIAVVGIDLTNRYHSDSQD